MTNHFVAKIQLATTEAGGRKGPLVSGEWRTVLGAKNENWSARLTFSDEPMPGDSFVAFVELLRSDIALGFFPVGAEFTVWEGSVKAVGRVISLAAQPAIQPKAPASGQPSD